MMMIRLDREVSVSAPICLFWEAFMRDSVDTRTQVLTATLERHVSPSVSPLQVWFCAWNVAGVKTQYENVRSAAQTLPDVALRYVEITPHKPGGILERLPLLSERSKGSLRSIACAAPLFWQGPVDVFWTQADTALFPVFATRARLLGIPWALSTDATTAQVENFPEYGMRAPDGHVSLKHQLRNRMAAYCYQHASLLLPWSQWAAGAILREYGVPAEHVHVVPPGVDLRLWPQRTSPAEVEGLPRLLFVGGDFERKGGPLLLDVFRARFRGRCELHLVTKGAVEAEDGVFLYSDLGPNDPRLRHLYQTCDALVLPTRADCFSLASIEAMAAGLPVITCAVGGIPEIVEDGGSGWLLPVDDGHALAEAIDALLIDSARAWAFGLRGRAIVEERFDARKNAEMVFHLLRATVSARRPSELELWKATALRSYRTLSAAGVSRVSRALRALRG
jgi:glycosyltransferase involved in cell wall biosynthesis